MNLEALEPRMLMNGAGLDYTAPGDLDDNPAVVIRNAQDQGDGDAQTTDVYVADTSNEDLVETPVDEAEVVAAVHASCTTPVTRNIRGKDVEFDQCLDRPFTHDGTDYRIHVYYTETNSDTNLAQCTDAENAVNRCEHALTDNDDMNGDNVDAVAMAAEAETAFRFYVDRNLDFTGSQPLPDGTELNVYIAEDPRTGGITGTNGIYVDDDYIDGNDILRERLLAFHEIQHVVQIQYDNSWDAFYGEGVARTIEDRADTALDADTGHFFIPEVNGVLGSDANRSSDLSTNSYRSVLWWTWLMDQYRQGAGQDPPVTGANDLGWNAIREYYEELETQQTNQVGALNDFIQSRGGSFRDDFIDYTLALYAYLYNPTDSRLGFIDTEINATGGLSGHNTHAGGPAFTTDTVMMNPRSSRYWEFNPANQCDFTAFSFDGQGDPYGFSVMTVDGGNLDNRWTSYSDQWARTVRTADLDRIVGVVSAFDQSGMVDVGHGCVEPTLNIKDPTSSSFEMVGLADNPRSFIVRLDVDGQDGGAVAGLLADDFEVTLNRAGGGPDITADIINSTYVQEDYWLLVQAPDDGDGAENGLFYDLTVSLGANEDTENSAVLYVERTQDVIIVLDQSGSMGGTTGKIEAARNAADLLVNELSDSDQGGFVPFDTDATVRVPLAQVGMGGQRGILETAIATEPVADFTSIGDGLFTAAAEHDLNGIAANQCSFVLLSDGMENEPQFWDDVKNQVIDNGCSIHAIALGPSANQPLMMQIAGSVPGGSYDYATNTGNVPVNSVVGWENNLSRLYDNKATQIAGRQRIFTQVAESAQDLSVSEHADFNDLKVGTSYQVGDRFASRGVRIVGLPFFFSDGTQYEGGFTRVENNQASGGTGNDLQVNNINLGFGVPEETTQVSLLFGDFGGNLNLFVNGKLLNFSRFIEIDGTKVGDVEISVEFSKDSTNGRLTLNGKIDSFAIGGQELWIDDVRFTGVERLGHVIPVDDASDVLVVSVGWQQNTNGTHRTQLFDPAGNPVSTSHRRVSSRNTNDVWEVPAPKEGLYSLRITGLDQEYFVTASAKSRYELYPFIGTPIEDRTQGAQVPIVASFIGTGKPITGADVTATVTDPANQRRTVVLFDDGNHGDGEANDGVYANVYTATSMGYIPTPDPGDVVEGKEPQAVASYTVNFLAIKDDLRREAQDGFAIDLGKDSDGDEIPDRWEILHGLDPKSKADADLDPDMDGLPSRCEFHVGTDPRNSDTDGGGESDGSEVFFSPQGRCQLTDQDPFNPDDDRARPLTSVVATAQATIDKGSFAQVRIGTPSDGSFLEADIMRRAFEPSGRLVQDWILIRESFSGSELIDRDVKEGLHYEYKVMPRMTFTESSTSQTGFEDLKVNDSIKVGGAFTSGGIRFSGKPFFFSNGQRFDGGFASVDDNQAAGGLGQDILINNINLDIDTQRSAAALGLLFGEYGGNLNVEINGKLANITSMAQLDGQVIDGVEFLVRFRQDSNLGALSLQGDIKSFSIGGQELWIDEVKVNRTRQIEIPGRVVISNRVSISKDPYAPAGSVLINDGDRFTRSPIVTLHLSADDSVLDSDGSQDDQAIPSTPINQLEMRISNSPDFTKAPWIPFKPVVEKWDLGLVNAGETATVYVQFMDLQGNITDELISDSVVLALRGDANEDGWVNAKDLNILALNWQKKVEPFTGADFNGDGLVNAVDLNILALGWQTHLEPSLATSGTTDADEQPRVEAVESPVHRQSHRGRHQRSAAVQQMLLPGDPSLHTRHLNRTSGQLRLRHISDVVSERKPAYAKLTSFRLTDLSRDSDG